MTDLTPTQLRALRWLYEHGGEGVIDRNGSILAGGERSRHVADTWLRLCSTVHLIGLGKSRLALSDAGRAQAERHPALHSNRDDEFGPAMKDRADPLGEYRDGENGYVR